MIPKTSLAFLVFTALLSFVFTTANAEVRRVALQDELRGASIVTLARIVSYDSDGLKFEPLTGGSNPLIVLSAKYSTDPAWNPSRFIRAKWPPQDEKAELTAKWPPIGAQVLVVTDKENIVSVFAWPFGETYRFWSPAMTGSVAVFDCKPLGAPINLIDKDYPDTSSDGCLVDKYRIAAKGENPAILPGAGFTEKSSPILPRFFAIALAAIVASYFIVFGYVRRQRKSKSN